MAKVFLSYSRDDGALVEPIAAALERSGHEVWWDRHIPGGEQFAEAIEKALHDADVVVALWSEAASRSAWVRDEAAAGRDSGRLVPVTLDGSPPPLGFRQYQTIDLSRVRGTRGAKALASLARAIDAKLGAAASPRPAAGAARRFPAPAAFGRRWAIAAVALVALVGGGLFASGTVGPGGSGAVAAKVRLGEFEVISAAVPGEISKAMNDELLAAFGSENLVSVTADASAPFVLEGSVRKLDDALRFTVNLKNVKSGAVVWTNAYDRLAADSLAPRQVAVAASQVVRCGLWGASSYRGRMPDQGLSLYLQFCGDYWGGSAADEQILGAARRVTAAVPDFSFGWSALALAAVPLAQRANSGEARELRVEAWKAAERSIALDGLNPEGYMAMAGLMPLGKFAEREALLKKAIGVRPTECGCERQIYGDFLTSVGRMEEAVEQYERARAMIPLAPFSNVRLAHALHVVGRHDEADRIITEMIEVWPDAATLRLLKVKSAYWTGRYADAIPLLEAPDLHLTGEQRRLLTATFQALASGDPARKSAVAAELQSMARNPRRNDRMIVAALAALGAEDAALDASRRLIHDYGHALAAVLFEPHLADAWRSPQYEQLVSRVGLTDYWRSTSKIPDICRQDRKPGFCAVA